MLGLLNLARFMKTYFPFIGPIARALLFAALISRSTLMAVAPVGQPEAAALPANSKTAPPPADLSYGFDQVVKLHEAGVTDKLLTAYVESAKYISAPKASEILYLHEHGVSEQVIVAALQKAPPAPEPAPVAATNATPVGSYVPPTPQPTVVYAQPVTVYTPPAPVYLAPPVVTFNSGYNCGYNYGYSYGYNYGYCSPYAFQPRYYAQRYNYYHYPRVYPAYSGVSVGFRFGGGSFHHR